MSEPYLSEIKIISWNYAPKGWSFCNGQFLPINQNQALFSLIGTTYGGNGQTTFALPDLRGSIPIHVGDGHVRGEKAGTESVTLTVQQMPLHIHVLNATNSDGTQAIPVGNLLARSATQLYAPPANFAAMNAASITNTGGSQAHENRQPFLTLNFIIALVGVFPSRN